MLMFGHKAVYVMSNSECLNRPHHVRSQINTQDSDGSQWQGNVDDDEQQEGCDFWDVAGQCVGDGLFKVIKDQAA